MKKSIALILSLLTLVALFTACGGNKLVGKWSYAGQVTYDFKKDGTVEIKTLVFDYNGTYTVKGNALTITADGLMGEQTCEYTYKVKGKTLTLTGDVMFTGNGMSTVGVLEKQ